jgi:hypothetical protein
VFLKEMAHGDDHRSKHH